MTRKAMPPEYVAAIMKMANAARGWLLIHPAKRPRFVLGPRDVMIVAPLVMVRPVFCKNQDALDLAEVLDVASRTITGDTCTVNMLDVLLEHVGIPFERVGLSELALGRDFAFFDPSKAGQA